MVILQNTRLTALGTCEENEGEHAVVQPFRPALKDRKGNPTFFRGFSVSPTATTTISVPMKEKAAKIPASEFTIDFRLKHVKHTLDENAPER